MNFTCYDTKNNSMKNLNMKKIFMHFFSKITFQPNAKIDFFSKVNLHELCAQQS